MKSKEEIAEFFGEVQRVISKYGIDFVVNKLREIQYEHSDKKNKDIFEYILVKTCNKFIVSKEDVLFSSKRGQITDARRMCYALMKEHLRITDEQIGFYFNGKSRQFINREIQNLPLNQERLSTKVEKKFVNDFLELTVEVLKYKNSYKLNNNIPNKVQ